VQTWPENTVGYREFSERLRSPHICHARVYRCLIVGGEVAQPPRATCTAMPWTISIPRIAIIRTMLIPLSYTMYIMRFIEYREGVVGDYPFSSKISSNRASAQEDET
jgi:hypothetical protein